MTGARLRSRGRRRPEQNGTVTMTVTHLHRSFAALLLGGLALPALLMTGDGAGAQERLPWERLQPPAQQRPVGEEDADRPSYEPRPAPYQGGGYSQPRSNDGYAPPPYANQGGYAAPGSAASRNYRTQAPGASDAYRPPAAGGSGSYGQASGEVYRPSSSGGYGQTYTPPVVREEDPEYDNGPAPPPPPYGEPQRNYGGPVGGYYSKNEIAEAGHGFFGSVSRGLASAIEYTFQKAGRPNGYILGEDAGGAFVAGLRYGEGRLHTKDAGAHKVYWQGPSLGYDFGGEGSKTMVLVYNLRDPSDIYNRFGGVQGAAYLVGGVSVQFQKHGDVVLAPIRSGIGLRLGANVGYLKYTRSPTWNPF